MLHVQYPEVQFKTRRQEGKEYIFDNIRKKWLVLTDEEWVRQNFVSFLINSLKYPVSVIALEKEIRLNQLKKRFDILVYNSQHKPWMMIECKSPSIALNEAALQQILRYNISVPVPFMLITNGKATIGWEKDAESIKLLQELPIWL